MKNKKDSKSENSLKIYFKETGNYIKAKYPFLILALTAFIFASAINFMKISTSQTVASFNLNDYEIGQNADRTIIADRTLPPDVENPVSVTKGEKIIKKGFDITEDAYKKLEKMSASPVYIDYRAFSNGELFLILLTLVWYMLFSFVPFGRKIQFKECLLQTILFMVIYAITALCGKISFFSDAFSICTIIPSALCVMLISILYGNLSSVLFSFVLSFGVLLGSGWQVPSFIFCLGTSLVSAAIVRKIQRRLDLVFAGLILGLIEMVGTIIMLVIFNETFSDLPKLLGGSAINGFMSGILTLGFLTPLEMILNTASIFRLMDLSDLNTPLFQKMMVQAGGTYSHTVMVAQLAENACREIGADALLARVGAYYHDIGKIDQSEYFTENQDGINKHDDLNPTLSVSVIRNHVKKGVEMATAMHLPNAVVNIIAEHHGNSVIQYFYNKAKEKDPSVEVGDFVYNGNPPSTRESAVVMLADTVEAACRSLDNPTVPKIEKFIDMLFNAKLESKQLDHCNLTFNDLSKIKNAFLPILGGFYHNRIKYQNQKDPEVSSENNEVKTEPKNDLKSENSEVKAENIKANSEKSENSENEKSEKKESPKKSKKSGESDGK